MMELKGKISDRIRADEIGADLKFKGNTEDPPSDEAVRNARGQGLGEGATRRRSGDGSK